MTETELLRLLTDECPHESNEVGASHCSYCYESDDEKVPGKWEWIHHGWYSSKSHAADCPWLLAAAHLGRVDVPVRT